MCREQKDHIANVKAAYNLQRFNYVREYSNFIHRQILFCMYITTERRKQQKNVTGVRQINVNSAIQQRSRAYKYKSLCTDLK